MLLALLLCLAAPTLAGAQRSVAQKKQAAFAQFERAQRMREALNGRPAARRTSRDYAKAMDAYRRVYYLAPTSSRADESALAIAELLAERARAFNEAKSFRDAIKQYEFLRREYPGSRYRQDALFTIAQIQWQDLNDAPAARATLQQFLKSYPQHRSAKLARQTLQEIELQARGVKNRDLRRPKSAATASAAKPNDREAPAQPEKDSAEPRRSRLPAVSGVRHWSTPDYTRVAIDLEEEVKYEAGRVPNPDRIFFDLHGTKLASELIGKTFELETGLLKKVRVAQFTHDLTRVVLEVDDLAEYSAFLLPNPYRLIIDVHGKQPAHTEAKAPAAAPAAPSAAEKRAEPAGRGSVAATTRQAEDPAAGTPADADAAAKDPAAPENVELARLETPQARATARPSTSPTFESVAPRADKKAAKARKAPPLAREAKPSSSGNRSLIRALGLKIGKIVVDAGHGGHDTGTIGPSGVQEKEVVLDVALRLGKLLEERLGADVVYTRSDDTFVPLETRTAIANKAQADLFISIHANSSHDESARGVETYYLNFTSSPEALEVAARENAVSEKSVFELQDLVKKIAMKEKIEESREFAAAVQKSLHSGLAQRWPAIRDRGVKKAPFIVLIGANMPSILAEISFVSNPVDERRLATAEHRQRIAESLYKGVSKYAGGLSGIRVASSGAVPPSQ